MKRLLFLVTLNIVLLSHSSELIFQISGHTDQDIKKTNQLYSQIFLPKQYGPYSFDEYRTSSELLYKNSNLDVLLLVKEQSKIVAFSLFNRISSNNLYIKWLGVSKDCQGKKIGTKVLHYLADTFKPQEIELMSDKDAVSFYEKQGFEIEPEEYEGQYWDSIYMRKLLKK